MTQTQGKESGNTRFRSHQLEPGVGWPGAPIPIPNTSYSDGMRWVDGDWLDMPGDRTTPVAEELAIRRLPGLAWWDRDVVFDFLAKHGSLTRAALTRGLMFRTGEDPGYLRPMHWIDAALHLGEARVLAE